MQLADATGLTPVHVNRVLKVLRKDGLAKLRKHEVEILDWNRLADVGGFDPTYLQLEVPHEDRLRIVEVG